MVTSDVCASGKTLQAIVVGIGLTAYAALLFGVAVVVGKGKQQARALSAGDCASRALTTTLWTVLVVQTIAQVGQQVRVLPTYRSIATLSGQGLGAGVPEVREWH